MYIKASTVNLESPVNLKSMEPGLWEEVQALKENPADQVALH